MTTPTRINDDLEGLPVAQGTWVDENTPLLAASGLRAELLAADSDQPSVNDKKKDKGGGYSMTTTTTGTQGESHQHVWGRFNDPTAQVIPDDGQDGGIPVATARPDDRQIRLAFLRKVYTILSAQLLVTFGVCACMALNTSMREFTLRSSAGTVLLYGNMVFMLVLNCFLYAYKRTYPHNYMILSAFTLSMSYIVGNICAAYEEAGIGDLVIGAIFITATVFIALTIFTLQSKWDFSFLGAGLGMCLWIMILWSVFAMIFGFQTGSVYAIVGSIVFSLYIIYDTSTIAERLDPEDYFVAAIEPHMHIAELLNHMARSFCGNETFWRRQLRPALA